LSVRFYNPKINIGCSQLSMNQSPSLLELPKCILRDWQLISQLVWREIIGRYQGSFFGLLWSFITPILMLLVYTFVFSIVFKAKWGVTEGNSNASFALVLFVGLIVHGFFADVLNRSPGLILTNINYVKKVLFPLHILPIVALLSALFHALVSLLVLFIAFIVVNHYLPWTVLLLPLVLLPLLLLALGLSWILASLGVYIRDVAQTVGIITTMLLFMAPVFFPLSAIPEQYHSFILANPLTFIIEQARVVVIFGKEPDWLGLGYYLAVAFTVACFGYVWFQSTRKGFADVL